jgi:predicted nuclease of predicted toxin-antitoxin system
MKVLLDMNISPSWVGYLAQNSFEAVHWSVVGDPTAEDEILMHWLVTMVS